MKRVPRNGLVALVGLLLALTLAACSSAGGKSSTSGTTTPTLAGSNGPRGTLPTGSSGTGSSGNTGPSGVGGLIAAQFPVCAQQAQTLATYLNTGLPTSNDPTYGDDRQEVLSLSGAQRALYIRQQADAYIEQCDQQQQETETQNSEQAAAASAAAKAAAEQQAAEPACHAVGGSVSVSTDGSSVTCGDITYIGTDSETYYGADAPMSPTTGQFTGPLETAGIGATQQECTSGDYPLGGNAAPGVWNSAVQGCLPPS